MTLDIDQPKGGDVFALFHPLQDDEFRNVFAGYVKDLSASSIEYYGITRETLIDRFATAYHKAEKKERQYFSGVWKGESTEADENGEREQLTLELKTQGSNVIGSINFRGESREIQHIHLMDKSLEFTFRSVNGTFIIPKGTIDGKSLDLQIESTRGFVGNYLLNRQ